MKLAVALFFLSVSVNAEHIPSWNCAGQTVRLVSAVSDVGDGNFSQNLYTLRKAGNENDKSNFVAYFLNVTRTLALCARQFNGKNDLGGTFELIIKSCEDEGDGIIPNRYVASGTLEYSHGPFSGKENVTCVFE